jgi:NapH/MauN family ferredoxin-type protein
MTTGGTPASLRTILQPPDGRRRPSAAVRRRRSIRTVRGARRVVQLGFAVFIIVAAVRHAGQPGGATASTDALCPFGGVETLWTWLTTGELIRKTHPSNLVLGVGVLAGVLLAGNAFCGWICPFGTLQDGLHALARRLHIPQLRIPPRLDATLRWGRYVVLGVIVYASAVTANLWFADYDPYVTAFSLRWLFEPNLATMWPALAILAVIVVGSLLVERFWCRYLCPAGAVFAVLGHLSILRIRRSADSCTGCSLCNTPCPVGIDVSATKRSMSTDCIGCLDCVTTCPVGGALSVQATIPLADLFQRTPEEASR